MVGEDIIKETLEYLKKQGPTNTFRLAREMGLERYKLLDLLKKLEEKQAIKFEYGNAIFLRFPQEEKKLKKHVRVKKLPEPKKKVRHKKTERKTKVLGLEKENKRLKEKLLELQKAPPKIRTRVKKIIQKIPVKSKKLGEQAKYIKKLEENIKELEQKIKTPQVIRRTITKKVPVVKRVYVKSRKLEETIKELQKKLSAKLKIIKRTIIKKIPVKVKREMPKPPKLLRKFEFLENIQKLHVPEILKKGR